MMNQTTVVLKLGGSMIRQMEDFPNLAQLILKYKQKYKNVVVVVSALKGYTDDLLNKASSLHPDPPRRELDMLSSVGERIAASLLCITLDKIGIGAKSYTGSQAGILTNQEHTQAKILNMTPVRLLASLQQEGVVVVAGFQGVCWQNKEITTLGRGGSDTTAVALGIALKASRVVFFKDTGGLFEADPKLYPSAAPLSYCSFDQALDLMKPPRFALHPRSILLAEKNQIPLHVCGMDHPFMSATLISDQPGHGDKIDFSKPDVYECST
jgi:aspartate kinase